ncbi:MAG: PEP/pyruvate-binding domain-containing protein, partial [Anaerolineaceae bacterium]|nr:PEP/pyruvate-binding domain-containing protein [Anaerolineaceae bacterium]
MPIPATPTDRLVSITLALAQYPILSNRIRTHMRAELFNRGVINTSIFEAEVRELAILSQEREGIYNPFIEEPTEIWDRRIIAIREHLTDVYFANHLTLDLFEQVVRDVLTERGVSSGELVLSVNPELAPLDLLFEQALSIEKMPDDEKAKFEPRLRETKVVLIRNLISDQLGYINIAKQWFTVTDLAEIRKRKIGSGRIGGKAAGVMLAWRILNETGDPELRRRIHIPESYFIGSDMLYTFMSINNLVHWNDQKYKPEEQMRAEFPQIQRDFEAGAFPPDVLERLRDLLTLVGPKPLIVRSSSLLEDNFGASFAGKYDSIFCPNQGTPAQNLEDLTRAIIRIFSTTLNPGALVYRRSKGLLDYDERMAILIQVVEGERYRQYFFPQAAGVAFSRNLYRWSPLIREQDGFIRLVWGLGTRAVDRVGTDYPRLVALSHPLLRPSSAPQVIRKYSQQEVDLIDLETNRFVTLPVHEVLRPDYPALRFLAQLDQEDYFSSIHTRISDQEVSALTLTFEDFLRRTPFAESMRQILHQLESQYHSPVDVEFTARVTEMDRIHPDIEIALIQCRPQSHLQEIDRVHLPANLPEEDVIFSTRFMVPQGHVPDIRYVLFITPEAYFALPTPQARSELSRAIGKLNAALQGQTFICVGPGRWGTTNPDLGVPVEYADVYNTRALVEMTGKGIGPEPDP